jgi:molybdopterin-guanine dinucleotide biosynthesis protein A
MNVLGAIQAGGRSSRMGTDKAWVELAGRPLIEHVLAATQPLAQRLAIILSRDTSHLARYEQLAAHWHATLLFDQHAYRGPLGGIHTSLLQSTAAETTLILACDLPFVTTEFLAWLQTAHAAGRYDLSVPLDSTGRVQMLAGFYEQACLPVVEALLAADRLRVDGLLARVSARQATFAEYAHLTDAAKLLRNLNSPADLRDTA